MTRLLYFGDSAATGFGTVTYDLGTELLNAGLDVRFITKNRTGEPLRAPFSERTWYMEDVALEIPRMVTRGFADGWKPDATLILSDFRGLQVILSIPGIAEVFGSLPSFHYVPVEGHDLPPSWKHVWDIASPIAMSKFGQVEIAKVTGKMPPLAYHGVNTDAFYPFTANSPGHLPDGRPVLSKDAAKAAIPRQDQEGNRIATPKDRVLIFRADRNMPRKRYASLLRAMPAVFDACPEADLLIHCAMMDEGGYLDDAVTKYPEFHERFQFTRAHDTYGGLPRESLAILYNAADIYVSTCSEGFGLTIAEALACGVPVVGLDYSAVPEVIGPAGVTVPVSGYIDNEYDHYWGAIDEAELSNQLIRLVRKPHERQALGRLGPAHIAKNFSWQQSAAAIVAVIERALEERREVA